MPAGWWVGGGGRRGGGGPRLVVDAASVVVAQGCGVGSVVPDVVAAVLVQVAVGVAAFQAVVVEGVGTAVLVLEGPAVEVDAAAAGVG